MIGIIYKLTFPNNKVYIGKTTQEFKVRMYQHKGHSYDKTHSEYNTRVGRAIRRYGWENIKKEIICTTLNEFINMTEEYFIDYFNSTNKKIGYNILEKSDSSLGYKHTDISKDKISKRLKGKPAWNKGKKLSDEYINNIKENHADVSGEKNPRSKKVNQFDLNMNLIREWNCCKDISLKLNLTYSTLTRYCRSKILKAYKGYYFRFVS